MTKMYSILLDKNVSVTDRVKVVRYAWKNPCDGWPNKDQALLDWLSVTLINRKRLPPEACHSVWKCLHDVLHTSKCQHQLNGSQQLLLKPALYQLLLNELSKIKLPSRHGDIVVSCCYKVLTSAVFSYVWSARLDSLSELLSQALKLCLQGTGSHFSDKLLQLIDTAAKMYTTGCKQSGNPQQVMQQSCQKIFLPIIEFRHAQSCSCSGELAEQLRHLIQVLESTLLTALFPSELFGNYELYLKLMLSQEQNESVPPKHISILFSQIMSYLQLEERSKHQAVIGVLPLLYKGFVQQYLSTKQETCFQFCQYLCGLLSVVPCKLSVTTETETKLSIDDQLLGVKNLLKVMIEKDVYNMAADHVHGDKQLTWFRSLSKWMNSIDVGKRSSTWFDIQRHLLELNYSTIEPNLKIFLEVSWLQVGEVMEAKESQANLLCDLVNMYTDLRQLPKLFSKLMEILLEADINRAVYFPQQLEACLLQNFLKQPLTVMFNIWQNILENFINNYLSGDRSLEALVLLCHLLMVVLSSIRVVDQSITQQVERQIHELMRSTGRDVLLRLVKKINAKQFADHTATILLLVHSWGQLQLLVMKYLAVQDSSHQERVHYYLKTKQWEKLSKTVADMNCVKCTYVWLKLQYQHLRLLLCELHPDKVAPFVQQLIDVSLEHLAAEPLFDATWNKQLMSLSPDNVTVAIWSEVCELLPIVVGLLTKQQMAALADHIVLALAHRHHGDQEVISVVTLTESLVDCGYLWENPQLIVAILYSVWLKIIDEISKITPVRPHKRRKLSFSHNLPDLLQQVLELDCKDRDNMLEFCKKVDSFMTSESAVMSLDEDESKIIRSLLQVMDSQPLLYMSADDQIKHAICTLALLSSIKLSESSQSLAQAGVGQLLVLYSGPGRCYLTKYVSSLFLLRWLVLGLSKQQSHDLLQTSLKLFRVVFQQVCHSVDLQNSLKDLSQEFISYSNKGTEDLWVFNVLIVMLNSTFKMSRKAGLSSDVRSGVRSLYTLLSEWLQQTVSRYWDISGLDTEPGKVQSQVLKAMILRGYGTLLRSKRNLSSSATNIMFDTCLDLLKSEVKDDEVIEACLTFIRSFCASHWGQQSRQLQKNETDENVETDGEDCADPTKDDSENKGETATDTMDIDDSITCEPQEQVGHFITQCWECLLHLLCTHYSQSMDCKNPSPPRDESSEQTDITSQIEQTLSQLITVANAKQFMAWLGLLLQNVDSEVSRMSPQDTILSLHVWSMLLESVFPSSCQKQFLMASQHLLLSVHNLVIEIHTDTAQICPLMLAVLTTQAALLNTQQVNLKYVSLVIHTCRCVPLGLLSTDDFVAVFSKIHDVLYMILSYYQDCVTARIPLLCLTIRYLLQTLVWYGRQKPEGVDEVQVKRLANCAHRMARLLNQLCTYQKECTKVAAYLVADYTASLHKVTLLPQVKINLLPGIYDCLRACDEYAIALLHATLPHGHLEVFKSLYEEYSKYYKYTGKV